MEPTPPPDPTRLPRWVSRIVGLAVLAVLLLGTCAALAALDAVGALR